MTRKEMREKNPDPKKYAWRKRGDTYILVDKQIIRWQEKRSKQRALARKLEAAKVELTEQDKRDLFDFKLFS